MQDNWLITQLTNRTVDGVQLPHVSVLIEFELRNCDVALNCQRTFTTHVFETSLVNSTAARNTINYRQVRRVSPHDTSGARVNETITLNLNSSHTSFYFAIQDDSSCIVITRLLVFYSICAQRNVDLIRYPESLSPPASIPPIAVAGSCVEHSQTDNGLAPTLFCSLGGIWLTNNNSGCRCVPGYFRDSERCTSCPVGTYLSPGNASCSSCPANSISEMEGLSQCTCNVGYYRTLQGEEDLPCECKL